jgi:hypothetical protein
VRIGVNQLSGEVRTTADHASPASNAGLPGTLPVKPRGSRWLQQIAVLLLFGRQLRTGGRALRQVVRVLDFNPEPDHFYYYIEPYGPPEDDGLQPTPKTAE